MGQSWIFAKRKPVASTMNPPQALKSLTIEGMVSGKISFAQKKSTRKIVACGMPSRGVNAVDQRVDIRPAVFIQRDAHGFRLMPENN